MYTSVCVYVSVNIGVYDHRETHLIKEDFLYWQQRLCWIAYWSGLDGGMKLVEAEKDRVAWTLGCLPKIPSPNLLSETASTNFLTNLWVR